MSSGGSSVHDEEMAAATAAAVRSAAAEALAVHRAHVSDLSTALMLSRFDTQDKVLDGIQREVRRTNGRVTALEVVNASAYGEKLKDAKSRETLRWRVQTFLPPLYVVGGAMLGYGGHAAGFW